MNRIASFYDADRKLTARISTTPTTILAGMVKFKGQRWLLEAVVFAPTRSKEAPAEYKYRPHLNTDQPFADFVDFDTDPTIREI